MSNGGSDVRVSAFAKRKRFHDESTISTPDPEPGSIAPPKKRVKPPKLPTPSTQTSETRQPRNDEQRKTKHLTSEISASIVSVLAELEPDPETNSFEPLVDQNKVSFSGVRQIVTTGQDTAKIRLSRGQICSVAGIARLWIRHGSITLYGAILNASDKAYTIFESENVCTAIICAESDIAEFQLESIPYSGSILPSELNIPGYLGARVRKGQTTFTIVEDPAGYIPPLFKTRLREARFASRADHEEIVERLERQRSARNPQPRPPDRILICGKASSSTAASAVEWINHFLTTANQPWSGRGVNFLDLNYVAPAFTSPGTLSLSLILEPILRPPYAFPITSKEHKSSRLMCSYYVGALHGMLNGLHLIEVLIKAMEGCKKETGDIPLVVRTSDWLGLLPAQQLCDFYKSLNITFTVLEDSSRSTLTHREAIDQLPDEMGDILFVTGQRQATASPLVDHQRLLQSHLRVLDNDVGLPMWDYSHDLRRGSLQLLLGSGPGHLGFINVCGGTVRHEDLLETLQDGLVTIIATKADEAQDVPSDTLIVRDFTPEDKIHHVGIGIVRQIDEVEGTILLAGSITKAQLDSYWKDGFNVGVVLEKLEAEGRYSAALAVG